MSAVDDGDVVATGIRHVNFISVWVHGNGDGILGVRICQRGGGVRRAINHRNITRIATLRIAEVRHVDEVRLRVHRYGDGECPNRDRRRHRIGRAVKYGGQTRGMLFQSCAPSITVTLLLSSFST